MEQNEVVVDAGLLGWGTQSEPFVGTLGVEMVVAKEKGEEVFCNEVCALKWPTSSLSFALASSIPCLTAFYM